MGNRQMQWLAGGIVVVILLLCLCSCCITGTAALFFFISDPGNGGITMPSPTPHLGELPPVDAPPATQTPAPIVVAPPSTEAEETFQAIEAAIIPDADLHELGIRFLGVDPETPRVASTTNPDYPVGTEREFQVSNVDTDEQFTIIATLVYKTAHVYMWVENEQRYDEKKLRQAADLFEEHTYPTNREFFGSEWTPGIDGDPHLSILHAAGLGNTVAGYFSGPDEYVRAVREDSNEMEMFYINIENVTIGDDFYNGVLAHEFQHMIHFANDRNEETWLNEGCSELAMALNDRRHPGGHYDVGGSDWAYVMAPDTQLTAWPEGVAGDASANYGAAYLFMSYFLERFGEEATQDLVAHTENGIESVDQVLREFLELDMTHKEVFADWTIANLLDDEAIEAGKYNYTELDLIFKPQTDITYKPSSYPVTRSSDVRQYGVDYIEVESREPLRFTFTGSTETKLINTQAHSGKYLWWSNRTDESDTRLTRIVDLSAAQTAALDFWAWYHIEEDWDYGYVMVGVTDNGRIPADLGSSAIRWQILDDAGLDCTSVDPNGNSFGCGFTGQSNGWEQLHADLTPYVGQEIALRFEYITDAAVNQPGFAIDDVTLTVDNEIILDDDCEQEDSNWIGEGFVRHANVLPQEWSVQVVTYDGARPQAVQRLLLADETQGEWTLTFDNKVDRAIIIISALAPVTTERAPYQFTLTKE